MRNDEPRFQLIFFKAQRLIAFSLLEIFKDILPAYRVRESLADDTKKDKPKQQRLKKLTKELVEFETSLVRYYKLFINKMERMINCIKSSSKRTSAFYDRMLLTRTAKENMAIVGTKCLCQVLLTQPNFNFRDNIIELITPLMNSKVEEISRIACQTISTLYKQDKLGELSLVCVKETGKVVKALGLHTKPAVLETFLYLKIKEVNNRGVHAENKKKMREKLDKMSKKEKKRYKKMKKLDNQLLETEAQESQQKKLDHHTDILSHIFFIYFRLLKQVAENELESSDDTKCLLPVLDGLSKFSHLINVDFYDDLISLLHQLISSGNLDNSQSLACLSTVFAILSDEGYAINVDPQRFYSQLYASLLKMDSEEDRSDADLRLLHSCLLNMILKKRKQMTMARVMAFTKRLATTSLSTPSATAASLMCALRLIVQNHSRCEVLMDTEAYGSGTFLPDLEDPEYCNANASKLWELHLLRKHYDDSTRQFANYFIKHNPKDKTGKELATDLLKSTPLEVYESLNKRDNDYVTSTHLPEVGKRKFHGFIFSQDSLTTECRKKLKLE
ncbi:Nucleolar complex protein 3 -like protein [Halotydeus destructor]|nr:Nucleolar complex protein 3 -like protein [Halotydeus destructor]